MNKTTIVLNSHSLSSFQSCEYKYMFRELVEIVPVNRKRYFEIGTIFSNYFHLHYYHKMKPTSKWRKLALLSIEKWAERFQKVPGIDNKEAYTLALVLIAYRSAYKHEELIPVAVERGFSKILYEDEANLFIWEGKPDLIATLNGILICMDHKTQSRQYNICELNNQIMGYMWASGAKKFIYNYIKLTKTPEFRRTPVMLDLQLLEIWKLNTIEWFKRVSVALQSKTFVPSYQCETKAGVCDYLTICQIPSDNGKIFTIKSLFKSQKARRSW